MLFWGVGFCVWCWGGTAPAKRGGRRWGQSLGLILFLHIALSPHMTRVPLCPLWGISCPMCSQVVTDPVLPHGPCPLHIPHPVPCRAVPVPIPQMSLLLGWILSPACPLLPPCPWSDPVPPGRTDPVPPRRPCHPPCPGVAPARCRVPSGAWPVGKGRGHPGGGVAGCGNASPAFRVGTGRAEPNRAGPSGAGISRAAAGQAHRAPSGETIPAEPHRAEPSRAEPSGLSRTGPDRAGSS